MKDDWRKRIESKFPRPKTAAEVDKERAEERRRHDHAEYERKLALHQRRFKCHIKGCTKRSGGPTHLDHNSPNSNYNTVQWDSPRDLEQCRRCHRWTCREHIHSGICKNHA